MTSETNVQHGVSCPISPIKKSPHATITSDLIPTTLNEALLLTAFRKAETANVILKEWLIHSQTANILNEMYYAKLQGQLAHQHKKKKGQKEGKVLGDGLPHLLSGDVFYQQVVQHEEAQR
ncbi:hypothetical protein OG21DRAFT_1427200 [Imleria badia]|nr:hypothetical protein OG21DRAFT_1427200 [Imleria badia]